MVFFKENPPSRSHIHEYTHNATKRISWGSIFAATFIILAVQATLVLLGMSIGLSTIDPAEEGVPFSGLGIGAVVWWTLSFIIALFIGGWITGRLSGIPSRVSGAMHGLVSWGFATIITMFMLTTTIGAVVGGAFGIVQSVAGGAAQVAGQAAPSIAGAAGGAVSEDDMQQIWRMVRQELSQRMTAGEDTTAQRSGLADAIMQFLGSPDEMTGQNRSEIVDALVERTDMNRQEAEQTVDMWSQRYQSAMSGLGETASQAAQRAEEFAGQAADVMAMAAFWAFIMMVLGAVSAAAGGALGAPFDEGTQAYYIERPQAEYARETMTTGERRVPQT